MEADGVACASMLKHAEDVEGDEVCVMEVKRRVEEAGSGSQWKQNIRLSFQRQLVHAI